MTNDSKIKAAGFELISWVIVLKGFVWMFNKEIGKRQFLTFPGNGYKKEKNTLSITRKKLQPQKANISEKGPKS